LGDCIVQVTSKALALLPRRGLLGALVQPRILNRQCSLIPERRRQIDVLFYEACRLTVVQSKSAERLIRVCERCGQYRTIAAGRCLSRVSVVAAPSWDGGPPI